MSITVRIPTPLRPHAGGADRVEASGATVGDALASVTEAHPALRQHLYDDDGNLRNFVNAYLNDDDVRHLDGQRTAVSDGDVITIVPSIAGGGPSAGGESSVAGELDVAEGASTGRGSDPGLDADDPSVAHASAPADEEPPVDSSALRRGLSSGRAAETELSHREIERYSRHLIMPEVGMEGQRKLKAARVLMIGAGGLGSPLGLYLAAAGVGRLGIVDFDVVDATNLQRQLLHGTADVGRPKLDSARERLRDVNPEVEIRTYETRLSSDNALGLFEGYDVIVDGTDNFPTRYLVNDACVLLGKPNVYGSIFRFEGQVSVFWAEHGPCYRCLFREPPPPGLVPSCAEGGVLGVLPGIVGALQALETMKLILGRGDPAIGRLLLFDALALEFRELKLRKDDRCPVCGPSPTVTELIDYEEFCGIPQAREEDQKELAGVPSITVSELKERVDAGAAPRLLDVREPHEWEIVNLGELGAQLMPLDRVLERMNELDSAEEMVVYCRSGRRSAKAIRQLQRAGFAKLLNLQGGILAWSEEIDPTKPKY